MKFLFVEILNIENIVYESSGLARVFKWEELNSFFSKLEKRE
jgi:hypothetical protein